MKIRLTVAFFIEYMFSFCLFFQLCFIVACGVNKGFGVANLSSNRSSQSSGAEISDARKVDATNPHQTAAEDADSNATQSAASKPKILSFKFGSDLKQMFLPPLNWIRASNEVILGVTSDKVFISTDGGMSWRASKLPMPVSDILLDAGVIYGVGTDGLIVSFDNGKTWLSKPAKQGVLFNRGKLVTTAGKLYVGTSSGLFVSTDKGEIFSELNAFRGKNCVRLYAYNSKLWVLTDRAILFSSDQGQTVSTINSTFSELAFSGVGVYGIKSEYNSVIQRDEGRLWLSTNDGQAFLQRPALPGQPRSLSNLIVHEDQIFVAAGSGLMISKDSGQSWSRITSSEKDAIRDTYYGTIRSYTADSNGPDSTVRSIVVNSGKIYAATETGLSFSLDGGNVWQHKSTLPLRYNEWDYSRLEGYRTVPRLVRTFFLPLGIEKVVAVNKNIFLQSAAGLYQSLDDGQSWNFMDRFLTHDLNSSGDSFVCRICDADVGNYSNPNSVFWSSDNGKTWYDAPELRGRSCLIENGYRINLSGDGENVMRTSLSVNNLLSGSQLTTPPGPWWNMIASEKALFLVNKESVAITQRETLVGQPGKWEVSRLPVDLQNYRQPRIFSVKGSIFFATDSGLFLSNDTGKNWTKLTIKDGLGSDQVRAVLSVGESILAGTSAGISVSNDGGKSWLNSKPELNVTSMILKNDKLYLSTVDNFFEVDVSFEELTIGISTPNNALSVTQVVSGYAHSCSLMADKTVKCWGSNSFGQIGDGTTIDRVNPTRVTGLTTVVSISAGSNHTCAILEDKTAKCWGLNENSQLGDGTYINKYIPTLVSGLFPVVSISAGGQHTCAILGDKTAKCWGQNLNYQLGDGSAIGKSTPTLVADLFPVSSISAGGQHTCSILEDKTVKCWGRNLEGQLGDGTTISRDRPTIVMMLAVLGSSSASVASVSLGLLHSCALMSDKSLKCWGKNGEGQLGDGTTTNKNYPTSVRDSSLSSFISVSAGGAHTCALLSDKTVKCWGDNLFGNLGNGLTSNSSVPTTVVGFPSASVSLISSGRAGTCALTGDSKVRCWGRIRNSELGYGSVSNSAIPFAVEGF